MRRHSDAFRRLQRQVARRRRDFLRGPHGRNLIFPAPGTVWYPSPRENAQCEAFVVLFVAELETYWEAVVNEALDMYRSIFSASMLKDCEASTVYFDKIREKRDQWQKNNNANWKKIEHYFSFIGLNKSKFPNDLWDNVEAIVVQRGDIVHNSLGIRNVNDPRNVLGKVASVVGALALFDRDFVHWMKRAQSELSRLSEVHARFLPGIGCIGIED